MTDMFSLHADLHYWVMKLKPVMAADKAVLWLATPNNSFNNQVPFDMIKEGRTQELEEIIRKLGTDVFN